MNHNLDDAEVLMDELIESVQIDVAEHLEEWEDEQCVLFVREFMELMEKWQPQAVNLKKANLDTAANGLYLTGLFAPAFRRAYLFSTQFLAAKESIDKLFNQ